MKTSPLQLDSYFFTRIQVDAMPDTKEVGPGALDTKVSVKQLDPHATPMARNFGSELSPACG